MNHLGKHEHASGSVESACGTGQVGTALPIGVLPGSAQSSSNANQVLKSLKERAARVLRSCGVKQYGLAFAMNVGTTLVARWFNEKLVCERPAPLAVMLAVRDDEFERLVVDLRRDREINR